MFAAAGAIGSTMARPPRTTSVAASRKFTHSPAQDEESPFDDSRAGSLLRACLHAVMRRYGRSRRRGRTPAPPAEDRSNRLPGLSARQRSNPVQGRNMQAETPPNVQPIECLFGATFQWTILLGPSQPAADQYTVSRLTWLPIACTWRMPVILPGCSDPGSTASDFRQLSFFGSGGTGAYQDTHHPHQMRRACSIRLTRPRGPGDHQPVRRPA